MALTPSSGRLLSTSTSSTCSCSCCGSWAGAETDGRHPRDFGRAAIGPPVCFSSDQGHPPHGSGVRRGNRHLLLLVHAHGLAGVQEQVGFEPVLPVVEVRVAPAAGEQLLMAAALDDTAPLDDEDRVGATYGRESVRDDERRAPLHELREALLDERLALAVERRRRLVED